MKKILAAALVLAMTLFLFACDKSSETTATARELLAQDPAGQVSLYGLNMSWRSSESAELVWGAKSARFDWTVYYGPELMLRDFDGDGRDELAVTFTAGTGSGIHYGDLYILDADSLHARRFEPEDIQAQFEEAITFWLVEDGIAVTDGVTTVTGELWADPQYGGYDTIYFTELRRFRFDGEGIHLEVSAWFPGGGVTCEASARVNYSGGEFTLTDITLHGLAE